MTTETDQPAKVPGATPGSGKRAWKSKALMVTIAAVVLFGTGAALGKGLSDPTTSDAYRQLADDKAGVEVKLEASKTSFRALDGKHAELQKGMVAREAKMAERESAVAASEKKMADADAAVKKREAAVTGAEAVKAKNTVGDGTWTVGRNIEAGTYVTGADVGSSCYWAIYASGTNGSDIVENDIPGGGRPSVVLSAGQDFKTARCGSWSKQ